MANLGNRSRTAQKDSQNPLLAGGWTVTFDPKYVGISVEYEVYHIAVRGPSATGFEVWIDSVFYSAANRSDRVEWDPSQPMHMRPGETLLFYFNSSSGAPPTVSIFCREVSPV